MLSTFVRRRAGPTCLGLLLMASGVWVSPVVAATDGSLGATSTGSISITASVPNRARISGLSDVVFASQDPATAASDAQSVCVWSNTATKAYTVTASGDGSGSAFTLASGGSSVPYQVQWAGTSGATTGTVLTAGSASASFASTPPTRIARLGPSASASLIVGIDPADLSTMSAGANYAGTLTLLVTPL